MLEEKARLILKFLLNGEELGLNVSDIKEVNQLPQMRPVKDTSKIIGLINLHGETTPVLDLAKSEMRTKDIFVALKTKHGPLCLLVERLVGFENVYENEIDDPEKMVLKCNKFIFQFTYIKSGSVVPVLDINNLI